MSNEFAEFVHGQLADLGEVVFGRFFGGVGFKLGDVQFAMCMRNALYLVVDDATRPRIVAQGSKPFQYGTAKGVRLVQRYYEVPEEVLEDRDVSTHGHRQPSQRRCGRRTRGNQRPQSRRQRRSRAERAGTIAAHA